MRIIRVKNYEEMSIYAARFISSQVLLNPKSVLGLATGSTPIRTYMHLVKLYNEGLISFNDVVAFNLDEYYPIKKSNPQSYDCFMRKHLFYHVDIKPENIHIPDGMAEDPEQESSRYENEIENAGGIDLQLLGIGENAHIGFNEPGESFEATTHISQLDEETIKSNARFFEDEDRVPTQAITMGIKTIMSSKKILLLANGEKKAKAVKDMLFGKITPQVPASVLQLHKDVVVIADEKAAKYL